jgi:hypothetical protein
MEGDEFTSIFKECVGWIQKTNRLKLETSKTSYCKFKLRVCREYCSG